MSKLQIYSNIRNAAWMQAAAMLCTLALCACDNTEPQPISNTGRIHFDIAIDETPTAPAERPLKLRLTSADGAYSHTWDNAADFQELEAYYAGEYKAEAFSGEVGAEGYGCPCYRGEATFTVAGNEITDVSITCRLSQAMVYTRVDNQSANYSCTRATAHTEGGSYIPLADNATEPAFISPGTTILLTELTDKAGHKANISAGFKTYTKAGESYITDINISPDNILEITCGTEHTEYAIDPAIFTGSDPVIECSGFQNGKKVQQTEGFPADAPILMTVRADAPLKELNLTINADFLDESGLPFEVDLLDPTDIADALDIIMERPSATEATIDFTALLESLSVDISSDIRFTLAAKDALGRISAPAILDVGIESVEFSLISSTSAMLGTDIATISLQINVDRVEDRDFSLRLPDGTPLEITDITAGNTERSVLIEFRVPPGIQQVPVEVYFMNIYKMSVDISRMVPRYTIGVDAFATTARIEIFAATEQLRSLITQNAHITANGAEVAIILRDPDTGILIISGLSPSKRYTIASEVIAGDFTPKEDVTTEKAADVPEGDFEDAISTINYKHLASGGIYSATTFPIYNQQNFIDIDVWWPRKHWASINEKTFSRSADIHNTWYMQPSAVEDFSYHASGSKSIRISSVGWNLHGEEIPPYLQEGTTSQPYSGNVPPLSHISAGRLFLGSYRFDAATMTETYSEGVAFGSRPSSLNGYYKYTTDRVDISDQGLVRIELVNDTYTTAVTVASAEMHFAAAPDFRTFNLPLKYHVYNVPATKLKIMFASSMHISEDALTDAHVPVSPDPSTASFTGSILWVDNLSFSY